MDKTINLEVSLEAKRMKRELGGVKEISVKGF